MLNYKVQIHSLPDYFKLKKTISKFSLDGYIRQNNFKVKLRSILGLLISLPLDEADISIEKYNPHDVEQIDNSLKKFQII